MSTDQSCQFMPEKLIEFAGYRCGDRWGWHGKMGDNMMVERFERSIKYEDLYLKSYENPKLSTQGIAA